MNCENCNQLFIIDNQEKKFYQEKNISIPKLCPDCRQQRRMAFRNERKLYKRSCDLCQKNILSIFSPGKDLIVYCLECYWSDKWSAKNFAQEFDFDKPFLDQLGELRKKVPQMALYSLTQTSDNCAFTNDIIRCKNCYLVFDGEQAEHSMYGETFYKINECLDFYYLLKCELCYECNNCGQCYGLKYCSFCENCVDSWFLRDCMGCTNCFGCANLINQNYCIYNKEYSREEYDNFINKLNLNNYQEVIQLKSKVTKHFNKHPVKNIRGYSNEKVSGDNLYYCKNAEHCFDSDEVNNCKYCYQLILGGKDSMDIDIFGQIENCYECAGVGHNVRNIIASYYIFDKCYDIQHSIFCHKGCHDLFGCVGLQKASYCILNKQYSKQEYEKLLPQIINHLKEGGIYGQFFPIEFSMFSYNETIAQDYYPLNKDQVINNGWKWKQEKQNKINLDLPLCASCSNNFNITSQEKEFYQKLNVPEPKKCFNCRHLDRLKLRNPRKLWLRQCAKCNTNIQTTYSSNQKEIVYCEHCYKQEVY
ncbi:MAG: zinc-ribbon domain containing protein [Patescibacteria group bacterium]